MAPGGFVNRPQLCRRPDIFTSETRVVTHRTVLPVAPTASRETDGRPRRSRRAAHPAGSNGQTGQSQTNEESRMAHNARAHCNLRCVCTPRPPVRASRQVQPHPIFFIYCSTVPGALYLLQHCSGVSARRAKCGGANPPYRSHCPCPAGRGMGA